MADHFALQRSLSMLRCLQRGPADRYQTPVNPVDLPAETRLLTYDLISMPPSRCSTTRNWPAPIMN